MRARLLFAFKLALAVGALALLGERVAWEALWASARGARPGLIALALALMPLNVGLETYRWHRLVRRVAPDVRYGESLAAVLSGYPLGLITPARLGDYLGRALSLRHGRKADLALLTFAERTATLAVILAAGLIALVPFIGMQTGAMRNAWLAVGAVGAAGTLALLVPLARPRLARRVLGVLLPGRRLREPLAVLDRFGPGDAAVLLALSAVRYGVFAGQFVLLVLAFERAAPLGAVVVGVALVFFAKAAIPGVTLGDLGVREGAAVFFLGTLGVGGAAAFDAALALFGINLLLPALVGLPLVLRLRIGFDARVAAAQPVAGATA